VTFNSIVHFQYCKRYPLSRFFSRTQPTESAHTVASSSYILMYLMSPSDGLREDWMSHLSVQFQLNQPLLRKRFRQKCNTLKFLTQTSEKVFHLNIGKLLSKTNSRTVIERNVCPLVLWAPRFYIY